MHLHHGLAALAESRPSASARPHAVFLHTTWRSGGTWLWSRLCAAPGTAGLYEPLHEALATVRPGELGRWRADRWGSGHGGIAGSYFEPYRTRLRPQGGLASFPRGAGPAAFFAEDEQDHPDLRAYLDDLLSPGDGAVKVLKFCRSLGRLAWMQRTYPFARHIVLVRNPASQWASMRKQWLRDGNRYFIDQPAAILAAARTQQAASVIRAMRLDAPCEPGEAAYRAFLAFWLLCNGTVPAETDAVLHLDLLGLSPSYATAAERQIAALTGIEADFSDARPDRGALESSWLGISRAAALRCHTDALNFVTETAADDDIALRLGALLSFATLRATEGAALLRCAAADDLADLDLLAAEAQRIRTNWAAAECRATASERRLDEIERSTSWALTAPLRHAATGVRRWMMRAP